MGFLNMLSQRKGALSPIKERRKKIPLGGFLAGNAEKPLRLYSSSKNILDEVAKESITGSVNCQ